MSKSTYAATFFLIWWVVLFAVLPWGVQSQHESGATTPGTDPGAPVLPKLGRKLLWTTLIAALLFAAFYFVTVHGLVTLAWRPPSDPGRSAIALAGVIALEDSVA